MTDRPTIIDQHIKDVLKAMAQVKDKFDVAEYLQDVHEIEAKKALSIVYDIEDRGLALNLGKGIMIINENGLNFINDGGADASGLNTTVGRLY